MTVEQALEINQKWTAEQARNDLERLLLREERPADKVVALAIRALERQIPKKICRDNDNGIYEQEFCPMCNKRLFPDEEYCSKCGQKLDWCEE